MSDDTDKDEIRQVRWKPDAFGMLKEMEDEMDRSQAWIANKAIRRLYRDRQRAMKPDYAPAPADAGVSTYRATFEFQLPAMDWADTRADDLFFEFLEKLSAIAPENGGAYGQIDAIRPMEYDARFHEVRLPGQWKYHLDESQMTKEQVQQAREEAPDKFLAESSTD